jgi:hypothetical protein
LSDFEDRHIGFAEQLPDLPLIIAAKDTAPYSQSSPQNRWSTTVTQFLIACDAIFKKLGCVLVGLLVFPRNHEAASGSRHADRTVDFFERVVLAHMHLPTALRRLHRTDA